MKTKYIGLAAAILFSATIFAQKDEMKTLKKIYEKESPSPKDVIDYKATITAAEPLVAASTESDKVYLDFFKASIPVVETVGYAKDDSKKVGEGFSKFFNLDNICIYFIF